MTSNLEQIRQHLKKDEKFSLLDENNFEIDDLSNAKFAKFNDTTFFPLDDVTEFKAEDKNVTIRIILHCWMNKDSSAAEYLEDCKSRTLLNLPFSIRNELLNWLSGKTDSYSNNSNSAPESNLVSNTNVENGTTSKKDNQSNTELEHERILLDHNTELRGSKPINFGYLIKDSELKLAQSIKSSLKLKKGHNAAGNGVSKHHKSSSHREPMKDPIILIPSAASSLFTLSNIKQFLLEEKYISPKDLPNSQSDLITIVKKLDKLSNPVKLLIVNNTRMFTKPEYWDRVVAVFTTGHKWQFNNYQWNTPQELFQHCRGFYFYWNGENVPQHVQQWNVNKVSLDKNTRYRDIEVARNFWYNLEKELISRGYH